jgi:hypothetical protein
MGAGLVGVSVAGGGMGSGVVSGLAGVGGVVGGVGVVPGLAGVVGVVGVVPGFSGVGFSGDGFSGVGFSGVVGAVPGSSGDGCVGDGCAGDGCAGDGCAGDGCVGCGFSGLGLPVSGGSGTGYGVGSLLGGGAPGRTGTGRGFGSTGTGVGVCARAEPARSAITSEAVSPGRPRSSGTARVWHGRSGAPSPPPAPWITRRGTRGNNARMNPAEVATALVIERTIQNSPAYRKVDDSLYVIKQGSAYVMINVVPWGNNRCMVRCTAQLVKGVDVDGPLAKQLLELNSHLRFGAFAMDPVEHTILFTHTILGGTTLDPEELTATLRDVALIADEYDDKLMKKYGGQRMIDLLEEAAMERIMEKDPSKFRFDD